MDSNIRIILKQKLSLKDKIKKVKNNIFLRPIDFDYSPTLNSFEMNGKIIYLQY